MRHIFVMIERIAIRLASLIHLDEIGVIGLLVLGFIVNQALIVSERNRE